MNGLLGARFAATADDRVLAVFARSDRLSAGASILSKTRDAAAQSSWPARYVAMFVVMMPLVAGVPRGQIVPMLRLSEVLQVGLMGAAMMAAAISYARGDRWLFSVQRVDWWMIALGTFGSLVPIVLLAARGVEIEVGAIAAAFALFKYLLLWLFVRLSVRTVADVAIVLFGAVTAACLVAAQAIPEGLGIGPTGAMARALTGGIPNAEGRAFTLLGSAISSGAVIAMCAAVTFGLAVKFRSVVAVVATGFLLLGSLATGQATSALAVLVVLTVAAWQHRVLLKTLLAGVPFAIVAALFAAPIIENRLGDVAGRSLVPQSWLIRWVNVTELYWPDIRAGGWIWGVHPNTVVVPPDSWRAEVFLESGYLWTLWVGGLPLLICFVGLLVSTWRALSVDTNDPVQEIARVAGKSIVVFMVVFNLIDPHLTLRGGADLFYVLVPVALAAAPFAIGCTRRTDRLSLVGAADEEPLSSTARIQIGEIGGPLLASSGWPAVPPSDGQDRGFDIAVKDLGATTAEARVFMQLNGGRCEGFMLHQVRAVDAEAETLAWRGIAQCADSLGLRSLLLPADTTGIDRLTFRELNQLAATSARLERRRMDQSSAPVPMDCRTERAVPVGVRLEPVARSPFLRRGIDVIVSLVALTVLAPLGLVLALLVRRSSPGPVLFRQMRVGKGGLPFLMLKFRSMDNSAGANVHRKSVEESLTSAVADTKLAEDPRITPVGAFMRGWSLDELPQLLNVLRGDMTLVGPRPSLLWETSLYAARTRRRLQLRPGLAGLWQASGRGDLSTLEMLELDLEYVDTVSWSTDARLLARTGMAVVKRTGAR